ncbi:pentapeptide repeat-containing protein [uncultured Hoeflea sp.]|uniref:NACHT domain-containing protein n=1 Tax=uncultured Hoeflea sp. TaxID=538666 RepID=UPI0030DA9EE7
MGTELPGIKLEREGIAGIPVTKALSEVLVGIGQVLAAKTVDPTQAYGAMGSFLKAFAELKPSESPGRLAFVLVAASLARCFEDMLRDIKLEQEIEKGQLEALSSDMLSQIEVKSLSINADFFLSPASFPFLTDFARLIYDRLVRPARTPTVKDLEKSLRRHYAVALNLAVMAKPHSFQPLQDQLFNQTSEPARRQIERARHQAGLVRAFEDMPLMGQDDEDDPVLLGEVYVPLRAFHYQPRVKDKAGKASSYTHKPVGEDKEQRRKVLQDFESYALDWIERADPNRSVMVLSGGPGMGKSSSQRALAARIVREQRGFPVFIPLQFMADQTTLEERIHHVLSKRSPDNRLAHDFLNYIDEATSDGPIVLMFDGLDELYLSDAGDDKPLRDLVSKITTYIKTRPRKDGKATVLAIVAGRIGAADRATSELEVNAEEIVHFLPFILSQEDKQLFVDGTSESDLHHDQRSDWWHKWQLRRPNLSKQMPERFKSYDLTPLSCEPLLLYFLAFAGIPESESEETQLNRNVVYDAILRNFHNRECKKDHKNLGRVFDNFDSEFEPVLQSLALAAWYDGSTRKGNMDDAFAALSRANFTVLDKFKQYLGKEPAFSASLAFHLAPVDGKNTYEFLHKTFAEYLVARRFLKAVQELPEALKPVSGRPIDFDDVLIYWIADWGEQAIDEDLLRFIRDEVEVSVKAQADVFEHCRTSLAQLLGYVQKQGIPVHVYQAKIATSKIDSFATMTDWARNAEEALLVGVHCTVLATRAADPETRVETVPLVDPVSSPADTGDLQSHSFVPGNMLARLQRQTGQGFIAHRCLSGLDFSGAYLIGADLSEANLMGAKLNRADLSGAKLSDNSFVAEVLGLDQARHLDKAHLPEGWSVTRDEQDTAWDIATPDGPYIDPRLRD